MKAFATVGFRVIVAELPFLVKAKRFRHQWLRPSGSNVGVGAFFLLE